MRKYYSGEILFCGVLRSYVFMNIVVVCILLIDRISQLLRCDVAMHFINT